MHGGRRVATRSTSADLDAWLDQCSVERCSVASAANLGLTDEVYDQELRCMTTLLGHEKDAPIAVAIKYSLTKPQIFVSSNKARWKQRVGDEMGVQRVLKSKDFAAEIGRVVQDSLPFDTARLLGF